MDTMTCYTDFKNILISNGEAFVIDYGVLTLIGYYNELFIKGRIDRDVYKKNVNDMISVRRKIRKQGFKNLKDQITDDQFELNAKGQAPFLDDSISPESYQNALNNLQKTIDNSTEK